MEFAKAGQVVSNSFEHPFAVRCRELEAGKPACMVDHLNSDFCGAFF
jgi:hypothetical protein